VIGIIFLQKLESQGPMIFKFEGDYLLKSNGQAIEKAMKEKSEDNFDSLNATLFDLQINPTLEGNLASGISKCNKIP